MCRIRSRPPSDRGQAVPLVAVLLALAVVLLLAAGRLGRPVADAAQARTAADAAALAGTVEGRPGAVRLATLHGGELVSFTTFAGGVEVRVRVGTAAATARATATVEWLP